jgi:hypothetical protein
METYEKDHTIECIHPYRYMKIFKYIPYPLLMKDTIYKGAIEV